jgi:hypothetical protein
MLPTKRKPATVGQILVEEFMVGDRGQARNFKESLAEDCGPLPAGQSD